MAHVLGNNGMDMKKCVLCLGLLEHDLQRVISELVLRGRITFYRYGRGKGNIRKGNHVEMGEAQTACHDQRGRCSGCEHGTQEWSLAGYGKAAQP